MFVMSVEGILDDGEKNGIRSFASHLGKNIDKNSTKIRHPYSIDEKDKIHEFVHIPIGSSSKLHG